MAAAPLPSLRPSARPGQGGALDLCTAWLAVEAEHTNAPVMALFNERREITRWAVSESRTGCASASPSTPRARRRVPTSPSPTAALCRAKRGGRNQVVLAD